MMTKSLRPGPVLAFSGVMTACTAAFAGQPADQAYDHYIGQFGVKNVLPPYIVEPYSQKYYDGSSDDLLTAGLGKTGLASVTAPPFANPSAPTPAELRRNAIWNNYRAVLDITAAGGYGTLYGPNVTNAGVVTASEGKIPGWEYIAYADDGTGRKNVTVMVQVPDSFSPAAPCIVTATASGSRGVYGAIGASGEWGLKQGCAVAYTDKGTGNGLHDLMTNTVGLIDGVRAEAATAGKASLFTAKVTDADRTAFNAATPNRIAYKHAHSQQNPEESWGQNTLQAIRFAFFVLNERYGTDGPHGVKRVTIRRDNTTVIASGISNGGTGALQAAEQDLSGLIDGVAITEPNAQPRDLRGLRIVQGSEEQPTIGKPLYDYFSFANLYQACAALALTPAETAGYAIVNALTPSVIANGPTRCRSLADKGLVKGATTAEQAADALAKLRGYGWLKDSNTLQLSHYALATPSIAMTYSNALGRVSVLDNLCGFSFATTTAAGDPVATSATAEAGSFSNGNGVPPTAGINIVYNDAANGGGAGKRDILASSPSSGLLDLALDGALCQRGLVEDDGGRHGWGRRGGSSDSSYAERVQRGIDEVQLSARLRGKPALIVHGRADALVPVNHSSRAYYGANQLTEGHGHRRVSYVEVTNAQHFDAFLGFPGYADRFIPLHVYLIRGLNRMYAHLAKNEPLPPSQVLRTTPRGPGAPPIQPTNVPDFSDAPPSGDQIVFSRGTLYIPD